MLFYPLNYRHNYITKQVFLVNKVNRSRYIIFGKMLAKTIRIITENKQ